MPILKPKDREAGSPGNGFINDQPIDRGMAAFALGIP